MFTGVVMAVIAESMMKDRIDQHFERVIRDLPIETQIQMRKERDERKEKARLEAIEERRHKELCEAIKSTKPVNNYWIV